MQEQDTIRLIGEKISAERKKQNLSKYYFKKQGVQLHQLDYIESGSRDYSVKTLIKVLNILKLNLWTFN